MRKSILKTGVVCTALILSGAVMAADEDMMDGNDMTTFEGIDTDGDHYISKEEAAAREDLSTHWESIDTDHNGRLNSSEFSAFEGEGRFVPPDENEIPEPGAAPYDPGKNQ